MESVNVSMIGKIENYMKHLSHKYNFRDNPFLYSDGEGGSFKKNLKISTRYLYAIYYYRRSKGSRVNNSDANQSMIPPTLDFSNQAALTTKNSTLNKFDAFYNKTNGISSARASISKPRSFNNLNKSETNSNNEEYVTLDI